jgi:hypothetical protein
VLGLTPANLIAEHEEEVGWEMETSIQVVLRMQLNKSYTFDDAAEFEGLRNV